MGRYDPNEIDEIIKDVRNLLGEDGTSAKHRAPSSGGAVTNETRRYRGAVTDETRLYRGGMPETARAAQPAPGQYDGNGRYEWNDPDYTGEYKAGAQPDPRRERPASQAERAAAARGGTRRAPDPVRPAQETRQASRAPDGRAGAGYGRTDRRRAPREDPAPARRTSRAAVAQMDDEAELQAPGRKKKRKKGWVLLLILALLTFGVYRMLAKQPVAKDGSMGARKPGVSTILLAGTDKDETRTDTIMLLNIDNQKHRANLVSIPRDTLVNGGYSVPKINSAYGWTGGGKDGMEELMARVKECIGFKPDGYVLVNLDSFVDLVDIMGGVDFDVPMDMDYEDPAQDLSIHLAAGEQHLDGEQSMQLVRFRSGYAMADLDRVNVQRNFVSSALDQWVSVKSALKVPRLLAWYAANVTTDMPVSNMTWIGTALLACDKSQIGTQTLPGSAATMYQGGSYYVLSPDDVADAVNTYCNPFEKEITPDDLSIRN